MDIKDFSFEEASLADAEEILRLQRVAYLDEALLYGEASVPPLAQTLDEMKSEFSEAAFIKASFMDGRIAGSVRARFASDAGVCRIGRLIVHPEFRRIGVGSQLMREIEGRFPEAKSFELFTGHRSARNLRLYSALGYKEFKRELINPSLTMVFLRKAGTPAAKA